MSAKTPAKSRKPSSSAATTSSTATKAARTTPAAKSTRAPATSTAKSTSAGLRSVKGGAAATEIAKPAEKPVAAPVIARGYVPLVDIPKPPPPPAGFTLLVGDKAVHPSHGLAEVTAIEHREIGSMKGEFYILKIIDNGMRVMVPRASSSAAGIRPVMSKVDADKVLETMKAREVAVDLQPWSRRFRAYTEMIKSGSPHEVAKVLRDMYRLKFDKDLSFGERRLLDQAKSLLMKELAAAKGIPETELQATVDDMFRS
ncbi:MAG: CarD-like transcriptional regulator [Labilithrix sp.]|nr:CarD-like transcriptional regulator [Labilithrix sp.]